MIVMRVSQGQQGLFNTSYPALSLIADIYLPLSSLTARELTEIAI